jgi:LCP family protein required for cell wall assembly
MGRIFATILILVLAAFLGAFAAKRVADPKAPIITTITSMFNPVPDPQTVFQKDRLAILLLGIDYNYNDKDMEYSDGARSDTIMALSLDLPTHSLHELSVPRDMKYTYKDGHVDKINAAYSLGGPRAAERAVANFLGIPGFDRYVVLRVDATKSLIDAIGGIDVQVTENMNYDDTWGHLHIHFKPGLHHMNGDEAVSYSRFRHDACSDPCRIKRQQQVMRITIAKLKNDKFNDLAHIQSLISVFNQNVLTDLSNTEKLSLAQAYSGFNMAALKTEQVPYLDDQVLPGVGDVLLPDTVAREALVKKLFLAPSPHIANAAAAAVDPADVHVDVQNGSGIAGLAKTVADRLRTQGFVVDSVENAATSDHTVTEIHVADDAAGVGERLRAELGVGSAKIRRDESDSGAKASQVTIIVGADYQNPTSLASPSDDDQQSGQ